VQRREFIVLAGGAALAWPLAASAQQPKILRVGTVAGAQRSAPRWVAFEERLVELSYRQGSNLAFEFVEASSIEEFEVGYRQLAELKVDIVVAVGPEIAVKSALAITRTLPIVMVAIDYDPIVCGYVTSLARPTGNVTGIFFQQIELAAKRVQIIKDAFPDVQGATVFWDAGSADQWQAIQSAAASLRRRVSRPDGAFERPLLKVILVPLQ
jgi:ABC-type uncharacterized transport system substrate-binding protein